jgi:hypothetical protein
MNYGSYCVFGKTKCLELKENNAVYLRVKPHVLPSAQLLRYEEP